MLLVGAVLLVFVFLRQAFPTANRRTAPLHQDALVPMQRQTLAGHSYPMTTEKTPIDGSGRWSHETNIRPERRDGAEVMVTRKRTSQLVKRRELQEEACAIGESFTIMSQALPDTEGCYEAVASTLTEQGLLYASRDSVEDRAAYPKLLTNESESQVWL